MATSNRIELMETLFDMTTYMYIHCILHNMHSIHYMYMYMYISIHDTYIYMYYIALYPKLTPSSTAINTL